MTADTPDLTPDQQALQNIKEVIGEARYTIDDLSATVRGWAEKHPDVKGLRESVGTVEACDRLLEGLADYLEDEALDMEV